MMLGAVLSLVIAIFFLGRAFYLGITLPQETDFQNLFREIVVESSLIICWVNLCIFYVCLQSKKE